MREPMREQKGSIEKRKVNLESVIERKCGNVRQFESTSERVD